MFDWLFNSFEQLAQGIVNAIVAGIAAILSPMVSTLPDMPALPTMPAAFTTAYSWVAWFFPVGTLVDVLAFVLAMWIVWQVVVLILRWAKASNE